MPIFSAAGHLSRASAQSLPRPAPEGLLPLVIGVTGHRDLDSADYPAYRLHIAELLTDLRQRYPSTPLRVISALAAGADRLAAEVALESGCELIVPLPLEPADYERDFPGSVSQFRALLARVPPEQVFVLPRPAGAIPQGEDPIQQREVQYREVGVYVAAQSHILLALWDGLPNGSEAGTAAAVRFKLEGSSQSRPIEATLDSEDGGPVFHVHARRSGSAPGLRSATWIFPRETDEKLFHRVCSRIDRFNADVVRARIDPAGAAGELLPDLHTRPLSDRKLADCFACADLLARRFQRMTHGVLRLILWLAAALALTFEVYAEILPQRALPAIYLVIFTSIALLFWWQRQMDAQGRYLDYRALAEGLRVQFYWRLAGLADNASASYLRKQLDELRWIRDALRGANTLCQPTQPRPDLVLRHWVQGQAEYFRTHAQLQQQRGHSLEHFASLCLAVGLLATASLVVFWDPLEAVGHWHHWLVLVMGFAPIAAALWEAYGERFGLRSQAHQYARFANIFDRAQRAMTRLATAPATLQRDQSELALFRELGREALMESGDWVLLLRDRPIVLPKG